MGDLSKTKMNRNNRTNFNPKFVLILVFLHLAIVFPLTFLLNIWMDEASSLYTTERGFLQTFQNVFTDEKQAPLYFLLLSLWRIFSSSVVWARLLSVIFACLTIKFFYDLTRNLFGENRAKFVSILFALNPFLIWTSLEIRAYSLIVLISVLLLKFFVESYLSDENSTTPKNQKILFTVISIIGLYTNYYVGFILVGCFVSLLILQRFRKAREYFFQMLIVAVLFAPMVLIIIQQLGINTEGFTSERSVSEGLRIIWNHFLTMIFPTELYAPADQTFVSYLRIWFVRILALTSVFLLVKAKFRSIDKNVLTFGIITATVGIFFLFGYFALGVMYSQLRHATVFFVPLVLFVFAFLSNVFPRKSWIVFALIFASLYSYSFYTSYQMSAKRGDWIRVARFIEANEKANQPIVIFQNYDALSLPYHYRGVNKILPDEKHFSWSFEDTPTSENALRKQIEFVISEIPPDTEELWLATEEICQIPETAKACQPLEKFIEANYTVVQEKDFYLERVRFLRKKK